MHKAYNFRLYPNKSQQTVINQTLGSCRFVYNYYLDRRIEAYKTVKETLNYTKCAANLKELKKELPWLKAVDSIALQQSLRDLDVSYKNFFQKRAGFPKFKSRRNNKQSYRTQMVNNNIKVMGDKLVLPKIGAVSFAKSREIEGNITSVTVKKTASGKYFASVLADVHTPKSLKVSSQKVGIDLGLRDLAVLSTGEAIKNPKTLAEAERKLQKMQRELSRKQKGSKNRNKARIKLAIQHEKVANIRKDFLHKLSTRLIHENQVICLETLSPKGMMKNRRLSKAIGDASWGTFKQMLLYKADWYGRTVHFVDRFFPSSQICSACGCRNKEIKDMTIRQWQCPHCQALHQRDINASINILQQGLVELGMIA
ncbi:IS200/IS605 family element RNA-guided endonuclease TnpB [Dethiobacter alkaliphilus]|uniref:Transposase, IS605 OrfB family n=1 Tax=Dethiobacter alkaliphilus AHT 1 TaxID=555088 RepID=C0GD68_DETAL|nr:IS200/IS605 family element RNA-guided endonuclease TnpB [Dethiobacter alkaliphilus]EEG78589.1 transposase, IS605 OrfB family [Dethiobacter alkaliphilus AHT 1]